MRVNDLIIGLKIHFKNNYDIYLSGIIGGLFFLIIFGFKSLNPFNINFLMKGDSAMSLLGNMLFNIDDWRWPLFINKKIGYPFGISILNSDSIPLLSFFTKVLNKVFHLPAEIQYFGIWAMACYILQGISSVLVLRHLSNKKIIVIICCLFFISSPILLCRVFEHNSLITHWLILFGIYLFFENKLNYYTLIKFSSLFFLSILICPYFLPMIYIFFLALLWKKVITDKKINYIKSFLMIIISFLFIFFGIYIAGLFEYKSLLVSHGWRYYAMNLNSLINPIWSRSLFLRTVGAQRGEYEGDNYLGVGLIILGLIVLPKLKLYLTKENINKYKELLFVCFFLFLYSLSSLIYFGNSLILDINLGKFIDDLCNIFRSSGRFFWPVWYIIVFCILKMAIKSFNKNIIVILLIFFSIQLLDLSPLIKYKSNMVKKMNKYESVLTSDEWSKILKEYKNIFIFEGYNSRTYIDFWYLSAINNLNINFGYINREYFSINDKIIKSKMTITKGKILDKSFIYILPDYLINEIRKEAEKSNINAQYLLKSIKIIDSYNVLIPHEGIILKNNIKSGDMIKFNNPYSLIFLKEGFSYTEEEGVWTDDDKAILEFKVENNDQKNIKISTKLLALVNKRNKNVIADIFVNGNYISKLSVKYNNNTIENEINIPYKYIENDRLVLTYKIKGNKRPKDIGINNDPRKLGLLFMEMKIE